MCSKSKQSLSSKGGKHVKRAVSLFGRQICLFPVLLPKFYSFLSFSRRHFWSQQPMSQFEFMVFRNVFSVLEKGNTGKKESKRLVSRDQNGVTEQLKLGWRTQRLISLKQTVLKRGRWKKITPTTRHSFFFFFFFFVAVGGVIFFNASLKKQNWKKHKIYGPSRARTCDIRVISTAL